MFESSEAAGREVTCCYASNSRLRWADVFRSVRRATDHAHPLGAICTGSMRCALCGKEPVLRRLHQVTYGWGGLAPARTSGRHSACGRFVCMGAAGGPHFVLGAHRACHVEHPLKGRWLRAAWAESLGSAFWAVWSRTR